MAFEHLLHAAFVADTIIIFLLNEPDVNEVIDMSVSYTHLTLPTKA